MSKTSLEVRVDQAVSDAAHAEATRRGTALDDVVEEALRRYLAAEDLGRLTATLRSRAANHPTPLADEEAGALAVAELAAWRSWRAR